MSVRWIVHTRWMSLFVQFFVAADDEAAAAVVPTGPGRAFPTVSGAWFDPDDAMMIWARLIDARTGRRDAAGRGPRKMACGGNDGSAVYYVPDVLTANLAGQKADQLRSIARDWQADNADEESLDIDTARDVVAGVGVLAREAVQSGHRVYCWAGQHPT